jgi:hypothetical protein
VKLFSHSLGQKLTPATVRFGAGPILPIQNRRDKSRMAGAANRQPQAFSST